MKKHILALAVAIMLLGATVSHGQVVAVDLNRAKIVWTWTPDPSGNTQTEFKVSCGQVSKTYTTVNSVGPGVRELPVKAAVTGLGNWFCVVQASNQFGAVTSSEIAFAVGVAPAGKLDLFIQAQ